MSIHKSLTLLSLALASAASQATTVEMILDISPTSLTVGHLNPQTQLIDQAIDATFVPQSFSTTVRWVYETSVPGSLLGEGVYVSYAEGSMGSSAITATPYANALGPSQAPTNFVSATTATTLHLRLAATGPLGMEGSSLSAPENADTFWAHGSSGWGINAETSISHQDSLDIVLSVPRDPSTNETLQAFSNDQIVDQLRSLVGQSFANAFAEQLDYKIGKGVLIDDQYVGPHYAWGAITSHDTMTYLGDVTIRSVTTIPEPSTLTLNIVGISCLAALLARRRTRRDRS